MEYRIFLVEDDSTLATQLQGHLQRYGYAVRRVDDFAHVLAEIQSFAPHLILMDVNLPYQDGFQLTRAVRRTSTVPVLFLSARAGEMEQVLGMESGGDDYLVKPFHPEVLLAKIRAMLRRTHGEYAHADGLRTLRAGDLELDLATAQLRCRGQVQALTRNEVKLLALLMEQVDRVTSRDACLKALWDDASFVDDNTLTVNVTRLRAKLEPWGLKEALQTRWGQGYVLQSRALGGCS